nr:MAG TPA: hypothetical protein [Caudoviricetes sp.]
MIQKRLWKLLIKTIDKIYHVIYTYIYMRY